MGRQYSQTICLNGHQVTGRSAFQVIENLGFCQECGSKLINSCPHCHKIILGDQDIDGVLDLTSSKVPVPKYCKDCGEPYPWTQTSIESANEVINLSDLNDSDKRSLQNAIPDLLTDTPKTKFATTKYKIFAQKAETVITDGLHDILVDVVSESVKKAIWGS
ncbi:DUF2321 domain-containing protein [uncultured Secundilactobacillus sp.]|uniref:DUF2321 domain-containing protein n=1 Tax=uncultured Secundilactobacillus sp. TaxID=2813935 RepID=UPI00258CF6F7|nr:DUF2321 domain-containing protein [uncultured Secundilactobacillus sp.]